MSTFERFKILASKEQVVLILIGIPGCGKSTFANAVVQNNPSKWKSVNQDYYGTRMKTYNAGKIFLQQRYSLIVDRCNFDESQRAHWIKLAHEFNCKSVSLILPDSDNVKLCVERAYARGDDGLHKAGSSWNKICNLVRKDLKYPSPSEGLYLNMQCEDKNQIEQLQNIMNSMK